MGPAHAADQARTVPSMLFPANAPFARRITLFRARGVGVPAMVGQWRRFVHHQAGYLTRLLAIPLIHGVMPTGRRYSVAFSHQRTPAFYTRAYAIHT